MEAKKEIDDLSRMLGTFNALSATSLHSLPLEFLLRIPGVSLIVSVHNRGVVRHPIKSTV